MPHDEQQFDTLPPAIADALRELDGPAVLPDADRDAAVLSGARLHLAPLQRKRRNTRWFIGSAAGGALAAAAMICVAVFLGDPAGKAEAPEFAAQTDRSSPESGLLSTPPTSAAQPGDLDHNGSLDILDAYALAKRIEQGRADIDDLNGDGQLNQRDIDWIANRAVALKLGEPG